MEHGAGKARSCIVTYGLCEAKCDFVLAGYSFGNAMNSAVLVSLRLVVA